MPLPCMRTDRPRPDPSPHRQELLDDLDELNSINAAHAAAWASAAAASQAAAHGGGINKAGLEEVLIEAANDFLHAEREWLENRLEEVR